MRVSDPAKFRTFAKYHIYQAVSFLSIHLATFLSLGDRGSSARLLLRTAKANARETFRLGLYLIPESSLDAAVMSSIKQ